VSWLPSPGLSPSSGICEEAFCAGSMGQMALRHLEDAKAVGWTVVLRPCGWSSILSGSDVSSDACDDLGRRAVVGLPSAR
jgi:hypothetical protein